jgi:hypothetical protein
MTGDAWFAGFADGEGCFAFFVKTGRATGQIQPIFRIGLRADDGPILRELAAAFGGSVGIRSRTRRGAEHPCCEWTVASKKDLAGLVRYFDEFPLRAKKARDYAIWREGVVAYLRSGCRAPELPTIVEALRECRVFESEEYEVPKSPQLRLVDGL